ncbi:MAG: U32 family peptidase [Clostridia bacterium]
MVEILAPAGDKEGFLAAIHNGANAIYLGMKSFNARGNAATNFTLDELATLVPYAHMFDVKVYLTVNTLVKEDEIDDVLKIIYDGTNVGIDAFIMQDIGMVGLVHKIFPSIEIHASTQMGIHNVLGALVAQKIGIKRVVLSRETTLEEIIKIKKETSLELEFFVQGALCVAFSGNCKLSHCLTGKSANRGECAQPCRHFYKAQKDGRILDEGYLLSAKDICLTHRLKELANAGICSFKIEGRARRPAYIAEATRIYSEIVNDNFVTKEKHVEDLKQAFNRGDFCEAYLDGTACKTSEKKFIYKYVPSNIGVHVGKVIMFSQGKKFNVVRISSILPLSKGDGLKFLRNGVEVCSIGVFDIKQTRADEFSLTTTNVVKENDEVRIITQFNKEKEAISRRKKLGVVGFFVANPNEKPKLTVEYKDLSVTVEGDEIVENAINQAVDEEQIRSQLCKTGGEIFEFLSVDVSASNIFLRIMEINSMRRKALSNLTNLIIKDYKNRFNKNIGIYAFCGNEINKFRSMEDHKQNVMVCLSNENQLSNELVKKSDYIAFNPPIFSIDTVKSFVEKVKTFDNSKISYLFLPSFASSKDTTLIEEILNGVSGLGLVINNLYGLGYMLSGRSIIAGPNMNIFNSQSINFLQQFGVVCNVVSTELSDGDCKKLNGMSVMECYYFAFGRENLMTICHCPVQNMTSCTCSNCAYQGSYELVHESGEIFNVSRTKLVNCTFAISKNKKMASSLLNSEVNIFLDFTGMELVVVNAVINKISTT